MHILKSISIKPNSDGWGHEILAMQLEQLVLKMVPIINEEYLKLHTRKLVTGIEQNVAKFLHQRNILLPNFKTRQKKKKCFKGDIFI